MEQIRAALAWLKEHHFWVLSVMVLGMAIGGWYMGSSTLASAYSKQKSQIDSEFSQQNSLRNKPFKPNQVINQRQQEETEKLAAEVEQVWEALYERQREKVLKWPRELGDNFVRYMEKREFGDPINDQLRQRYLDYIEKRFPELLKIVDAEDYGEEGASTRRRRPGGQRRGGEGGRSRQPGPAPDAEEETPSHLVDWLDQSELRERLDLSKRPDSLEVWVLQEDLWVYEALLGAIAATNEATGAARQNRAAVRVIEELQVGRPAAGANNTTGRLAPPDTSGAIASAAGLGGFGEGGYGGGGFGEGGFGEGGYGGGGYGGGGGFGGGGYGGGGYGGGFGEGGFGEGASDGDLAAALLAGRYIDETGTPIETVPPDYSFGQEYKRLPVRMVLEMDHRWLTDLLLELANAPLQVEIDQVRINPAGASSGGQRSGRRRSRGELQAFDRNPNVGTTILQGAVYIFNPPDESVLTIGEDAL